MISEIVNVLVDRFLTWSLPKSVRSNLCVTMMNYPHPRYGTNLLTADEARQMIEYLLETVSNTQPSAIDAELRACTHLHRHEGDQMKIGVLVTEIIRALEREATNTDTDPRWLAASELRRMDEGERRTLICDVEIPSTLQSHTTKT